MNSGPLLSNSRRRTAAMASLPNRVSPEAVHARGMGKAREVKGLSAKGRNALQREVGMSKSERIHALRDEVCALATRLDFVQLELEELEHDAREDEGRDERQLVMEMAA